MSGPSAGHYVYDLSGSTSTGSLPATAALTVSNPAPNRQLWSLDARGPNGEGWNEAFGLETSSDGLHLASYRLDYRSVARVTIEFTLSPAAMFVPRSPAAGRQWAFDATTTDGCYRIHSGSKVAAVDKAVSAGSTVYRTDVLDTATTLQTVGTAGCQHLDLRQTRSTAFDRETRLVVRDENHASGTFSGFPFRSDVTATLRSAQPS